MVADADIRPKRLQNLSLTLHGLTEETNKPALVNILLSSHALKKLKFTNMDQRRVDVIGVLANFFSSLEELDVEHWDFVRQDIKYVIMPEASQCGIVAGLSNRLSYLCIP